MFELLSTYGISINNIEIERPVRVGTRTHRADIVVHRDGSPYMVIECKRWKNKKIEKGVDQAISYADANTIKGKFAVFTNGDVWRVKRKLRNNWVDIPDISKNPDSPEYITLDELILIIQEFKPILYWFGQIVQKKDAHAYFYTLQNVFNGAIFPLDKIDCDLCFATDNLLRVLSAKGAHENYIVEKMCGACRYYSKYFEKRFGTDNDLFELNKDDFFYLFTNFSSKFDKLVDGNKGIVSEEGLMIRLVAALFHYLWEIYY